MNFDTSSLMKDDFIYLETNSKFGSFDCIVLDNDTKNKKLTFLMTAPYEEAHEADYEFIPMFLTYGSVESFEHKNIDDLFMLWGKTDPRILSMLERFMYHERKNCR